MDFALTEEHRMVQHMVRDFAQKEVAPVINEYDRKQEMAPFVLPRMGELGILGICLRSNTVVRAWTTSRWDWPARNSKPSILPCGWSCRFTLGCAA